MAEIDICNMAETNVQSAMLCADMSKKTMFVHGLQFSVGWRSYCAATANEGAVVPVRLYDAVLLCQRRLHALYQMFQWSECGAGM